MKLTTKDIIKILPFEQSFKLNLTEKFDLLTPDQKFTIEQVLWDTYFAMYKLKREENLELALQRAKENQEVLDKDFYKRVEEQTEKEMQDEMIKTTETVDLAAARKAMETIVQEIHAAKKQPLKNL